MRKVSMTHSARLCTLCVVFLCFKTSNSTRCKATCLLFGVELQTFKLSVEDKCEMGDYLEDCSYLEGVLLPLHNSVREDVASGRDGWPRSSNMRLLSWDKKLEILARESLAMWLSTSCTLSPEECFWTSPSENFIENYGMHGRSGDPPDPYDVAATWMFLNSSEPFDDVVRQKFSRVVRAQTTHMGCSDAVFTEKGLSARFLLCLYSPGLDDNDKVASHSEPSTISDLGDVYTIGEPCSNCPPGTACNDTSNYPSLCADIEVVELVLENGVSCSHSAIQCILLCLSMLFISTRT